MDYSADVLIIGAGITGCSVAREISRYSCSAVVLEQACDIAEGATKANSGIVHAGFDALPGSAKAKYNMAGAAMFPALCKALSVPYRQIGALVAAFGAEDRQTLLSLMERGRKNGVAGLRILEKNEVLEMEPNINPDIHCALYAPASGIVSPYELAYALADDAALNGVRFHFNEEVSRIVRTEDGFFSVHTKNQQFKAKVIINCAGSSAADFHNMLSHKKLKMVYRRGQYYLLDRSVVPPFSRTVFQCPSVLGKGVLISPTVHGNTLIGPNAEDIADPLDTSTTSEGLQFVLNKARITWPVISVRQNITNFSGIRAHLTTDDFMIGPVEDCPGAFEAAGIESPGLSSAPAIGRYLAEAAASALHAEEKSSLVSYIPPLRPFREMTSEEQAEAVQMDSAYGNIICRCEVVTEAEIRAAIRRPVGATTIDGIKRRTRSGMGRCQGGFCMPRVLSVLADELGTDPLEITKDGGSGLILSGTVENFLKGVRKSNE